MVLALSSAMAQYNPSGLPFLATNKTLEQPVVNPQVDSLQMVREREWNKHLIINSDSRLDSMIQIHREENTRKNGFDGYRVQIFQGTKDEAYQVKARFISQHEEIKAYVSFQDPYFRVRLGDFRTKSEAIKLKQQIKSEFAASYVVEDLIYFPDLLLVEKSN